MPVTCICEFVVVGRQFLQTLDRNRAEIPRIRCILGQHHCAPGYKAVYKRFRPHVSLSLFSSLFLLSLKNQTSSYSFPTIVIPSPATTSTFTPSQRILLLYTCLRIFDLNHCKTSTTTTTTTHPKFFPAFFLSSARSRILYSASFTQPPSCQSVTRSRTRDLNPKRRISNNNKTHTHTLSLPPPGICPFFRSSLLSPNHDLRPSKSQFQKHSRKTMGKIRNSSSAKRRPTRRSGQNLSEKIGKEQERSGKTRPWSTRR